MSDKIVNTESHLGSAAQMKMHKNYVDQNV